MTRILLIPNANIQVFLDYPMPPEKLVQAVSRGEWTLPPPYDAWLAPWQKTNGYVRFFAERQGNLVILRPLSAVESGRPAIPHLTTRQYETLRGLAAGLSTRQIAQRLSLQPRSISYHIAELKNIFQVQSRAELIHKAEQFDLLDPAFFHPPPAGEESS